MSILNALKTSVLSAGFVTLLFAGAAEAISFSTAAPNEPLDIDVIDGFTETTGNIADFITFDAVGGETVSFDFSFTSGESAINPLFRDGGFYTLNGDAFLIADATDAGSISFDIASAGQFTLGFGAVNATSLNIPAIPGFPLGVFDNEVSVLDIQNVTISDADPQAVPEPATMLGLMAVAALGGSSVLKRKHS
jgi:hypothetical protein